jgi:hypothetical protein
VFLPGHEQKFFVTVRETHSGKVSSLKDERGCTIMINMQGILIGTGILWALNMILVAPITNVLVKRRLAQPAYAGLAGATEADGEVPGLKSLVTQSYILVDTLVLGAAGFLFGAIMGWYFIGVSFKAQGWPGMIAFIVMSMVGASMKL